MMRKSRKFPLVCMSLVGVIVLSACRAPQPGATTQGIPKITKLYKQATTVNVHRFRKPLRDRQARALRQITVECDRMLADMRGEGVSAEALTGSVPSESDTAVTQTASFEKAIEELGAAARSGDVRAMRSAHSAAMAAYQETRDSDAPCTMRTEQRLPTD